MLFDFIKNRKGYSKGLTRGAAGAFRRISRFYAVEKRSELELKRLRLRHRGLLEPDLAIGADGENRQILTRIVERQVLLGLEQAELADPLRGDTAGCQVCDAAVRELKTHIRDIDLVRLQRGIHLAREAAARGAVVTLVLGPATIAPPPNVETIPVRTADEMRSAVIDRFAAADVVVMAAAVADFRPKAPADRKMKKDAGVPELMLELTPDILAELGERKRADQFLVGFAAETEDVEAAGRTKLRSKRVDALVANAVGREGTGFGSETNEATILVAGGRGEPMRAWSKAELASAVCDLIAGFLTGPGVAGRLGRS